VDGGSAPAIGCPAGAGGHWHVAAVGLFDVQYRQQPIDDQRIQQLLERRAGRLCHGQRVCFRLGDNIRAGLDGGFGQRSGHHRQGSGLGVG